MEGRRMKKIIALFLSFLMLFSGSVIYADDAVTDEVVADTPVTENEATEEVNGPAP